MNSIALLSRLTRSSIGSLLLIFGMVTSAIAQVRPDRTLPRRSRVTQEGDRAVITEGTQADRNLFHSFRQFSVPTNGTASFQQVDPAVETIFVRVTGSRRSTIDGIIEAFQPNGRLSSADLFLMNPNGIVFGENAFLNLGGSFLATTANSIDFDDGTQFRADASQLDSLLTVSVPIGLQLGDAPGRIVHRVSQVRVRRGETLAFLGETIRLQDDAFFKARSGRAELGAVADGQVSLTEIDVGWQLGYENVDRFGAVNLEFAGITTRGDRSGSVQIQADSVRLTDLSFIAAETTNQDGGDISIRASRVVLDDFSLVSTSTDGAGQGGDIIVAANRLAVRNGSQLISSTFADGNAGDIRVMVTDQIDIDGGTFFAFGDSEFWAASGLFTSVEEGAAGDGGQLILSTNRLQITAGANISAFTRSAGNAGSVEILASDIELSGVVLTDDGDVFVDSFDGLTPRSGIFTNADFNSQGNGNDLRITTERLTVQDGAVIRTGTFGEGDAGDLIIQATEFIEVRGTGPEETLPSILFAASGGIPNVGTANFPEATGDGGTIRIRSGDLWVLDGGAIAVGSLNPGGNVPAGELQIQAQSLLLDEGSLRAETVSGDGGNISLRVSNLFLQRNNSLITTTAGVEGQGGNGGNITIDNQSGFIIAASPENSDIIANAFEGRGGNVRIATQGLFGIEFRDEQTPESDITATSTFGIDGNVEIETLEIDPRQGLVELPNEVVVAELLQGCQPGSSTASSQFVNSGRGGIADVPTDVLENDAVLDDIYPPTSWDAPADEPENGANDAASAITEAQGWIVDHQGNVVLHPKPYVTFASQC